MPWNMAIAIKPAVKTGLFNLCILIRTGKKSFNGHALSASGRYDCARAEAVPLIVKCLDGCGEIEINNRQLDNQAAIDGMRTLHGGPGRLPAIVRDVVVLLFVCRFVVFLLFLCWC